MKKMRWVLLNFVIAITLHSCTPIENANQFTETSEKPAVVTPTETNKAVSPSSDYESKLSSFAEIANSFDPITIYGGNTVNSIFNEVITKLYELLTEEQSIIDLEKDVNRLMNDQGGFYVKTTDPVKIGTATYRFVEVANAHGKYVDGAVSSLLMQYWTEDRVGYIPLVESYTSTGESTTVVDYRIFEDQKVISILQLRQIDVFEERDTYNLFLLDLTDDNVVSCFSESNNNFDDGYWQVVDRDYNFYIPERIVAGILIFENSEGNNMNSTEFEFIDLQLTLYNNENLKSRIIIELEDYIRQ